MKKYLSFLMLLLWLTPANAQTPKRTADPAERGYKDSDFPRVQKLAPNVYSYEVVVGSPNERYTTNSMFVVTREGVLIADGQGTPDALKQMLEAIARITPVPVK